MREFLVDSNVLLDVCTEDPTWSAWSSSELIRCGGRGVCVINPVIYAEISVRFARIEELDRTVRRDTFRRDPLPWEACFLAGKAYVAYRRRGGRKRRPLPDFFIGAHAALRGMTLLTRDARRYRTYFPKLRLISPE